jgi:4-aminobutyrate aminotransferase (EC 2.6.1.19)
MEKTKLPIIIEEPPGKKAKEYLKLDEELISPSYARYYPLYVERVEGNVVIDVDGNKYIDFNSGLLCLNIGRHPRVVKAIKDQAEKLIHYSITDFYYTEVLELSKRIAKILPIKEKVKFHYCNSGTEANEGALKLARYHSQRQYLMGFIGAFHGRTYGSLSLTASKPVQREKFGPLLPSTIHVPYPYCYRCPFGKEYPECDYYCIRFIEEWIFEKMVAPEEVAAIIFEPVLGEGGFVWPPKEFFKLLKKITEKYGILLIDDEVQSGIGRTGKWFAIEHFDVEPDIITIAKAIASGMPLGVTVAKAKIMDWSKGAHATTFGGNPVACAAAIETINVIEEENLLDRAAKLGEYIKKVLNEMKEKYEIIGDVRGEGLMIGVELVKDRKSKEYATKEANELMINCWKKGLLIITAGKSVLRIAPPLTIEKEYINTGLQILEEETRKINSKMK